MNKSEFGYSELNSSTVEIYELKNKNGVCVKILSLGAAIQSILLPWSKSSNDLNVVLGYDNVKDYELNPNYFGVIVGRVAGRIKNGCFSINDKTYQVTVNNAGNCLHGGKIGLSRKNWKLIQLTDSSVELECQSCHKDEGFPGHLVVNVKYSLGENNDLKINYNAKVEGGEEADEHACPVNLTNHSYFNLSGINHVERGIRDHVVQIYASKSLELNPEDLTPTGNIIKLADHPVLDLSQNNKKLDELLTKVGGDPIGFDHYYILDKPSVDMNADQAQALVQDDGTLLKVYTDQPGIQFYTSNFFKSTHVSGNLIHEQHGALCLEAQNYPDAINHVNFPNCMVDKNHEYSQTTIYQFCKI